MFLKTKRFSALLFIYVLLLGQLSVIARKASASAKFDKPARLVLNGIGEPKETTIDGSFPLLTEAFYPIGWSEDGNFAYYSEPADEACGCYFARLVIQNLRTDKVLWNYEYVGEENIDESISTHWKLRQKLFDQKLSEFGIKPLGSFSLLHPAFSNNGDEFTPRLEFQVKTDVDFTDRKGEYHYGSLGTAKLTMTSLNKGSKVIYQKKYHPKYGDRIEKAEISGVLVSPFEARSAVVLVEEHRGYEGPPNITKIRIVGSDLTSRFK